jgi:MoaA/NifB/PqqE/SkfB family radical SAM enzyme
MLSTLNYARNLVSMALGREPIRPLLFSYYVTHRCALNCRYCSDGDGKRFNEERISELSTAEAKKLVSILRAAADILDITGGEPMVREDLEEILAHARGIGFLTVLNTKGIGLEARPDLMRLADVLVLSLDTLDAGSLAELIGRPRDVAEQVLDALRFALSRRASAGTRLVLSAVATPGNLEEVSNVLRFAVEHSIGFHVSPEIMGVRANPELRGSARYRRLVGEIIKAKGKRRGILGVPEYLRGIRDFRPFRCHPFLMPVVRPDGRMYYPCLESPAAEIDILEKGDYLAALKAAQERCGSIPKCLDCCHIFCHMGLSLFQRHPLSALGEVLHWRN